MIEINEQIKEKLVKIFSKPFKVFLVEDHEVMRKGIELSFKDSFPAVTLKSLVNFVDEDVEDIIQNLQPEIVLLDNSLGNSIKWNHPVYGNTGSNLIPLIKKESPGSIIISISDNDFKNQQAMREGADCSVGKNNIGVFLESFS